MTDYRPAQPFESDLIDPAKYRARMKAGCDAIERDLQKMDELATRLAGTALYLTRENLGILLDYDRPEAGDFEVDESRRAHLRITTYGYQVSDYIKGLIAKRARMLCAVSYEVVLARNTKKHDG
jgi:hypothetical protein